MNLSNILTPIDFMLHDFRVKSVDGGIYVVSGSGFAARCDVTPVPVGTIKLSIDDREVDVAVVQINLGNVKLVDKEGFERDFPAPEEGKVYITSTMVAQLLRRPDVLAPDTTKHGVIRGSRGGIVAVKQLQKFI